MSRKHGRWPPKWNWRMGFCKSMIISMLLSRNSSSCRSVEKGSRIDWYQKWKLEGLYTAPKVIDHCYPTWKPNERQTGAERISKSQSWIMKHCYRMLPDIWQMLGSGLKQDTVKEKDSQKAFLAWRPISACLISLIHY